MITPDYNCTCPLTDTQLAIYTYCRANPDDAVYQICAKFGAFQGVDAHRLKSAVEAAINKHPILKVRIATDSSGKPFMRRNDYEPPIVDFLYDSDSFRNAISIFGRLYDIAVIDGANGCELIVCVHHVIFDGYSMSIFINDISLAYRGGEILTEKQSFFDVASNEQIAKQSEVYDDAKKYFLQNFPPVSVRTFPPYDCFGKKYQPSTITRRLSIDLERWQRICQRLGFTGNIVSTTVFAMVLGCFCGESAARFSTVFHGRHGRLTERTVGMFTKTIPVSVEWGRGCLLSDLMRQIRWQLARCMVNDIYPFAEIKRNCGGFGDISFIYQGNTVRASEFCGEKLVFSFLTPSYTGSSLSMELWHGDNCLELTTEYDSSKYSLQLVENMVDAFSSALSSIEIACIVDEINFLSSKMTIKLDNFNRNASVPNDDDIVEMFCRVAAKNPSSIAVKYLKKSLTYSELDIVTNRIANYLTSLGACLGKNVAILSERSEMLVVLPLSVLKTGAAYVPLSIESPDNVLLGQLSSCNADMLLTDRDLKGFSGTIIRIGDLPEIIKKYPSAPPPKTSKKHFAIFFTSGSTGKPKGVKISHRNVAAYCKWYHGYFSPSIGCVIAAYNNFAFDASITDIFPALTSGATVAVVAQNIKKDLSGLSDFCDTNNVNIIDLPTQIGRIFAANKYCKTLRHIVLGGEAVSPFVQCANYQIYNQYGPTETTVAATIYKIIGNEPSIPIGKPLDCVKIYVADSLGRRVPVGAIGEIWIAGAQVSEGYLDDNDNANKFIINPFDDKDDFHDVFRTGDFGRWREDGNLEFWGRRDNLVKIRGYRVEISELEFALKQCEDVLDAVATTFEDSAASLQIAAYVVGSQKLDIAKIRLELQRKLPPQVVPQSLQQISALPLTPNGKIDRKKLPKPEYNLSVSSDVSRPLSTTENIVCHAFAEVLNIPEVGADANFFEIGGTSILAMQVVVNLENLGLKIKYADIFERPTARALARISGEDDSIGMSPKIIQLKNSECLQNPNPQRFDEVVITGATGFFGAHLLNELLENSDSKIHCIVRGKDGMSAKERLDYVTNWYFDSSLLDKYPERLFVLDGDITECRTFEALESLVSGKILVVNCAAIVKHFAEKKLMDSVNVDAVKHLIDFSLRRDCDFVQISTLSAAVGRVGKVDEQMFCELPTGAVPYVASKWKAEQLVFGAVENGLKLKLIRLGNLSPRSTDGVFQINAGDNAAMNLLNVVRRLGCYPKSLDGQLLDFTPVDNAARDVARLMTVEPSPVVFHVFNPQKVLINDVVDARMVDDSEFARLVEREQLTVQILMKNFAENNGCNWDNEFTISVLKKLYNPQFSRSRLR